MDYNNSNYSYDSDLDDALSVLENQYGPLQPEDKDIPIDYDSKILNNIAPVTSYSNKLGLLESPQNIFDLEQTQSQYKSLCPDDNDAYLRLDDQIPSLAGLFTYEQQSEYSPAKAVETSPNSVQEPRYVELLPPTTNYPANEIIIGQADNNNMMNYSNYHYSQDFSSYPPEIQTETPELMDFQPYEAGYFQQPTQVPEVAMIMKDDGGYREPCYNFDNNAPFASSPCQSERSDSGRSSTSSNGKNCQKMKRTRATKSQRNQMTEQQKKEKKQADNRKNTQKHTERKNERRRELEESKATKRLTLDNLVLETKQKKHRLVVTSEIIGTEIPDQAGNIKQIADCFYTTTEELGHIFEDKKRSDEKYKQKRDDLNDARNEFEPFLGNKNKHQGDVLTNTYGSRKSRAKAKMEMAELEFEVADLDYEIEKMQKLSVLTDSFQENIVQLFEMIYKEMSEEDKIYWKRSIISQHLGEFKGIVS